MPPARTIHVVLDNLNTHFRGSFEQVLGVEVARQFLARIEFHYTPKHASWLNMAEIEIGILDRQCLGRRTLALTGRITAISWVDDGGLWRTRPEKQRELLQLV